jgi:hypothetical protein
MHLGSVDSVQRRLSLEEHVAEEAAELQVEDERPFEPRVAGELYTGNVGSFVRVKQA